jgi:excisionase family DNA binding protein
MSDFDSRYLTVPQVASDLQLDVSAVYKMCKAKELPSVRFGKSVRIPRLVYERHLQGLERAGPERLGDEEIARPGPDARLAEFRACTGKDPQAWLEEWRSGEIPDTPENARRAIRALALRDAMAERADPAASHLSSGSRSASRQTGAQRVRGLTEPDRASQSAPGRSRIDVAARSDTPPERCRQIGRHDPEYRD